MSPFHNSIRNKIGNSLIRFASFLFFNKIQEAADYSDVVRSYLHTYKAAGQNKKVLGFFAIVCFQVYISAKCCDSCVEHMSLKMKLPEDKAISSNYFG